MPLVISGDPDYFRKYYRMTPDCFEQLHALVEGPLMKRYLTREPLPSRMRLAITLKSVAWLLASSWGVCSSASDSCSHHTNFAIPAISSGPKSGKSPPILEQTNGRVPLPCCYMAFVRLSYNMGAKSVFVATASVGPQLFHWTDTAVRKGIVLCVESPVFGGTAQCHKYCINFPHLFHFCL